MEKKELSFANIKRSLNRLEGFMDDLLLNAQSFSDRDIKDVWTQLTYWVTEVHNNREGDDSINYFGVYDCVDFILNNNSIGLAKMAFSIETKVKEIESIVLSYVSYQITQKVASDFLRETGRILWQIGELYIDPFIQETEKNAPTPNLETGNKNHINGQKETPKEVILTRDDIINSLAKIKPFEPLNPDEPINYKEYYKRLCDGGVIDSQFGLDLFTYCVERADISKIVAQPEKKKDCKKSFARLFMNDVASVFSAAADYRKAAAKAFNLGDNTHIGSVGGDVKTEYQELMKGFFKTNWQKKN